MIILFMFGMNDQIDGKHSVNPWKQVGLPVQVLRHILEKVAKSEDQLNILNIEVLIITTATTTIIIIMIKCDCKNTK
jgi:hypothetical protein